MATKKQTMKKKGKPIGAGLANTMGMKKADRMSGAPGGSKLKKNRQQKQDRLNEITRKKNKK